MRNESSQPIRCGCGGKAKIQTKFYTGAETYLQQEYCVRCEECGTRSGFRYTEDAAVEAWNLAMSGVKVNFHPVIMKEME